jgi:hypothetical protein
MKRGKKMNKFMRSFLILPLLASLILMSACQAAPKVESTGDYVLQITQIDTTEFPKVNVYVSVRDLNGEPQVINTGKLQLLENGQPVSNQEVLGAGEAGPLTTMLLIDNSGSMNFVSKLDSAKLSPKNTSTKCGLAIRHGVITFNKVKCSSGYHF